MAIWIEVAKFLAGVAFWDMFVHASFLAARIEPKLVGIHFTDKRNKLALVAQLIIVMVLIYIGWFSGLNV